MPPEPPPTAAGSRSAIRTLDGLRALAVGLVLLEHLPVQLLWHPLATLAEAVPTGYLGVDLFFVLSGFLISRILIVDRRDGVPVRYFLARRALRIFPAYYLMLVVAWLAWPDDRMPWLALATYTVNYTIVFGDAAGFFQHAWSLAVEEHFYLLWPLFMAFAPRRALLPITLGLLIPIAVGVSLWLSLVLGGKLGSELVMYGTQSRMLSLLIGAVLAFGEHRWRRAGPWSDLLALAAVLAGIQLVRSVVGVPGSTWSLGRYFGSALACTGVVVFAVRADSFVGRDPRALVSRALAVRPLAHLGRISYGIYLYHNPIIFLVGYQVVRAEAELRPFHAALAVAGSIAVAELSFWCFERPFLRLKGRFTGGRKT